MAVWKGHETFLRAIALLPRQLSLRGYVIGGGIYQTSGSEQSPEKLHSLAAALGISERLGFTGFLDQPAAAIRALDIVVHASTRPEPFGRVIVEAMGCGRAVITTATGGAAELITPGENALEFRAGDSAHLAQRILQLAQNPQLRARLGAAGRETALKNFDRKRLGKQLTGFYQQVVERVA
jgi:glycosyltransferase involved in cell wall biosynthesis